MAMFDPSFPIASLPRFSLVFSAINQYSYCTFRLFCSTHECAYTLYLNRMILDHAKN